MGESYFLDLNLYFDEPEKLELLSQVESVAARSVEPLLKKYNLVPRTISELHAVGKQSSKNHKITDWQEFMAYIVRRYPAYLDEFADLKNRAPVEDRSYLTVLTAHEVAVIKFAEMELNGDPSSSLALRNYIDEQRIEI